MAVLEYSSEEWKEENGNSRTGSLSGEYFEAWKVF